MTPKLASLQIAFFFESTIADKVEPDQLSVDFKNELQDLHLKSKIFEVPKELNEFPFLTLQGDKEYKITVTNIRGDFYYTPTELKKIEDERELLRKYIFSIYDVLEKQRIKIIRVGNISTFAIEDANPIKTIKDKFINPNQTDNFDELFIRFNKKQKLDNLELNVLTTITSAINEKKEKDNQLIIIQKDINSVKETKYNFDKTLLQQLIDTGDRLCTSDLIISLFK